MLKKYSELFNYQSFELFLIDWYSWNEDYDKLFKIFMSSEIPSQDLKTDIMILYEKIRRLNRYGLIVFKSEIQNHEISKKLKL